MSHLCDIRASLREEAYWWLPDTPQTKVAGTLTFDQTDGIGLSLLGTLRPLAVGFDDFSGPIPAIHGITKAGKPVTVLNSFVRRRQLNMPGIANEEYRGGWLLLGTHSPGRDNARYSKSAFRFDGIEQWLGHDPIKPVEITRGRRLYSVEDPPQRTLLIKAPGFSLVTGSSGSFDRDRASLSAKLQGVVHVEADEPQPLDWHWDVAARIQALASLCAGKDLPLAAVRLKGPSEDVGFGLQEEPEIDVLVSLIGGGKRVETTRDEHVFSAEELIAHSPSAIAAWYDAYSIIEPALRLYFSVNAGELTYSNVRFLLATQALEVYHRRTHPGGLVSDEEYAALADSLLNAIPSDTSRQLREKLQRTLEFANELSLGQRIKALTSTLRPEFGRDPVGMSKAYIGQIVATRNYNTHYTPATRARAFTSGSQLHWATRRIITLLTIILLRHIGVPSEQIRSAMKRSREFSSLLSTYGEPT